MKIFFANTNLIYRMKIFFANKNMTFIEWKYFIKFCYFSATILYRVQTSLCLVCSHDLHQDSPIQTSCLSNSR